MWHFRCNRDHLQQKSNRWRVRNIFSKICLFFAWCHLICSHAHIKFSFHFFFRSIFSWTTSQIFSFFFRCFFFEREWSRLFCCEILTSLIRRWIELKSFQFIHEWRDSNHSMFFYVWSINVSHSWIHRSQKASLLLKVSKQNKTSVCRINNQKFRRKLCNNADNNQTIRWFCRDWFFAKRALQRAFQIFQFEILWKKWRKDDRMTSSTVVLIFSIDRFSRVCELHFITRLIIDNVID